MAGQLLLALAILITFHELGHFLAARAFGIRVEKFYLFFDAWGIKLFSIKRGDTEYGIGWLPLGGYVKIAGMIDESLDKDQMAGPPQPWEFRSKPAWQRLIVMVGGVTVNILLGIAIFVGMLLYYGNTYTPMSQLHNGIVAQPLGKYVGFETGDKILKLNGHEVQKFEDLLEPKVLLAKGTYYTVLRDGQELDVLIPDNFLDLLSDSGKGSFIDIRFRFAIGEVDPSTNASKAGLEKGDIITSVDGVPIEFYDQFTDAKAGKNGKELVLGILRNGDSLTLRASLDDAGILGFRPKVLDVQTERERYSLFQAIPAGTKKAYESLAANIVGFGKIFRGEVDASKSVAGPIKMATFFGSEWIWEKFWNLTGLISLVLAFMNILPIPALDGGHVVFLLVEMLIRRPLPDKLLQGMQVAGMVILLSLMVLIFGNDIWNVVVRKFL